MLFFFRKTDTKSTTTKLFKEKCIYCKEDIGKVYRYFHEKLKELKFRNFSLSIFRRLEAVYKNIYIYTYVRIKVQGRLDFYFTITIIITENSFEFVFLGVGFVSPES